MTEIARIPRTFPPRPMPWWMPLAGLGGAATVLSIVVVVGNAAPSPGQPIWWATVVVLHLPYAAILAFLVGGFIERIGFFLHGRAPEQAGVLPPDLPAICVQLPMFNEHLVAGRVIEAAARLDWPRDRFEIQVLDDSSDADTRELVDRVCECVRASGTRCRVVRRETRTGYKAGALEEARHHTAADFLVLFDADFVPSPDFLRRAMPYFFDSDGRVDDGLAMVQAQWGHLNDDESALTRAQSLWVDDHHTLQMSWRSAKWGFVNFTGTAGIWRAAAVERAGGWRATSLVEDCELSFRHLFVGYRTRFVKEIVVPAELPATVTAYRAQQKRWTQGWVQLQRLHLRTLMLGYATSPLRRLHLVYHMSVTWQWALWTVWILMIPMLIQADLWLGVFGPMAGIGAYIVPSTLWLILAVVLASVETRHTYPGRLGFRELRRRLARVIPYVVVNTGMLPHQACAFAEGLFGSMYSEFERTPKTASSTNGGATPGGVTPRRSDAGRIKWPCVTAEVFFIAYQTAWAIVFLSQGLVWCAIGAFGVASCVAALFFRNDGHVGRRFIRFQAPGSAPRGRPASRDAATDAGVVRARR
jgi:cellulose synthase/poly-beta-1,6-N-acetylglucosamine synthase-like glycosyltransferase